MQLKATKLAALLPRLNFALYPTLALLMLVGLAVPLAACADQWVRFTITKKNYAGSATYSAEHDFNRLQVQLNEFGLYSADGLRQNVGLDLDSSDPASQIAPGKFHYKRSQYPNHPNNLFDSQDQKWCCTDNAFDRLDEGDPSSHIVFTMHLREDAAPVVKYNLRSGGDTYELPGRAPVCWKVETSDNGIDWIVRDVRDDQATSGYTTKNNTWYGGGGNSNDGPTTFYVFQPIEYPLPAGFTRLEWIKSTRAQRILTDYKPNPKTWMQVDCKFSGEFKYVEAGLENHEQPHFFGTTRVDPRPRYNMAFGGNSGQNYHLWYWPDSQSLGIDINGNSVGANAIRSQLTVSNGVEKAVVEWTGGITKIESAPSKKQQTCLDPLVLFGSGDNNFGSYEMTVWSWKIYESDSGSGVNDPSSHLVHNFIPALSPTGVPGLFDSITGEFLSSATATPFEYKVAVQWFRVTFTERWGRSDTQTGTCYDGYFQLGEFALFDELGNQVNKNLTMGTSATELAPNQYFAFNGGVNADMCFNGSIATVEDRVCFSLGGGNWLSRTAFLPQSITMRLAEDAATVVKYNLATGADTGESIYRHPSAWKLEASSDGVNWTVVDEQRIDGASWVGDWIGKNKASVQPSWYAGGGQGAKPTKFYALQPQELPLPAGFTRLEWIKSTRQQRILTDYYPNPKTWMQVDCMFSGDWKYNGQFVAGSDVLFFGTVNNVSRSRYQMNFGGDSGQSNAIYYSVDSSTGNFNVNASSVGKNASRNLLTISNGVGNVEVEWTGGIPEVGNRHANKVNTCQDPLVLFGCGDKNFGSYEMTVWSWKIYESDSGSGVNDPSSHLVHNFIPALSPTGVPGLFDSITGEFLSSATATPFAYQKADQWFRFTMTKKFGGESGGLNRLELDELALYTAENVNVATGLLKSTASATAIPAGMFVVNSMNYNVDPSWPAERVFDGSHGDNDKVNFYNNVNTNVVDCCYTIHLSADAGEVVKYNLMTGGSLPTHQKRTPIAWTMERSYDGVNWELVDERTDESASGGCPKTPHTWYNNGGQYNATTGANAVPSNFYWFAELPLPELLQSEYDYVGYKLVPAVKGAEGLIASGTTAATNTGTYKIVYSLPAGAKWVGGSTAPYEIEWSIVSPRPKFLERLAADTRRVDNKGDESLMPTMATGGDLILKDEDLGVFIHVFTNTTGTAQFHANQALDNASVLVVAGGGQGGPGWKGNAGGGGAGGVIYREGCSFGSGSSFSVTVGAGGRESAQPTSNNGANSVFGEFVAIGGGAGAGNDWGGQYGNANGRDGGSGGGAQYNAWASALVSGGTGTGGQGFNGGSVLVTTAGNRGSGGGGAGEAGADIFKLSDVSMGGNGRKIPIVGYDQCFGGGGAGYQDNVTAMGGVGGGGCVFEGLNKGESGENGLGGGGGGHAHDPHDNNGVDDNGIGAFGGDGIVIVRYSYNTTANVKVAKPTAKAGLLYNGCTQLAVEEGEGYVLSGRVSADNAGSYTATATLLAGYEWADGSTSALTLSWRIDPAPITGVRLSVNAAQYTGSPVAQPTIVAVTTANGLTITDANCGWDFGYERDRKVTTDFTSLGYISVVVTGKGNLTGTKAATFRIYDPTKIPLPKPVQVYEYTGNPITPTFEPTGGYTIAPKGYTPTSGNYAATECGVYTVTCTLENGKTWENGSTGPYEVTWEIVKKQTFLEKLASDPRRVNGEGETDFDTGLAQGGDLVLFDPEASAFIHVFTNTAEAAAATFTARQNLNAWVLAVGGGGSGGNNDGGGGGAGGMIEDKNLPFAQEQSVSITIGAGAPGVDSGHGFTGSQTQINIPGLDSIIAYGGGGGGCVVYQHVDVVTDEIRARIDGYGGENVGSGGGASGYYLSTSEPSGSGAPGRSITMYKGVKQGNDGGAANNKRSCPAGGGGGAGAAGETPDSYDGYSGRHGSGQNIGGYGGVGRASDILGISQYFAGGGGSGGNHINSGIALGGEGGGGNGAGYSKDAVSSSVPVAQAGENGLGGGGGGGKGGDAHADYKYGAPGGDGIVIIRYMATPPITVPVPTAKTGLFYNGNTQVGVPESFAYTLADYYATTAGTYTATATLNYGYRWADSTGDDDLTRTVEWTILNYMRLEAIDNGSDPAKAGYVPLTGFKPKKDQAIAMTFSMNRELMNIAQMLFAVSYADDTDKNRTWQWNLNYTHHGGVGARVLSYAHGTYNGSSFDTNAYVPITNPDSVKTGGVHTAVFARTLAKMSIDGEPIEHNITGVTVGDALMEFPHDFGNDLTLFCSANVAGNPLGADGMIRAPALAKIYGFTVMTSEDDPTPVLDLVPVQDTTTKARGFYDLVNGNFYPLKTPVVLDGNGGEPERQYVYVSKGDSMPALPNGTPTRDGFDFNGYALNGWEVKPMTGKETDFIDEGESIWAYMAYAGGTKITLNKTDFVRGLNKGINQGSDTTNPAFTMDVGFSAFNDYPKSDSDFTGCTPDYKNIVNAKLEFQDTNNPRHDRVTFTLKQGLEKGKSYAVQIISYHYTTDPNSQPTNRLGFSENTYYENCAPVNPMGVSFVYRFEATNTTHSFTLYKPTEVKGAAETAVFLSISAIQLREIGEDASVMDKYLAQYYDKEGTPVKDCDFGEGTTLYAQWEPGKYRVINPETGPKIAVDPEWLNGAFGSDVNYQAKLFTTNASGVVAWQAYVLGYEASEVVTAAIVEETAQNADPDTVTIRLRGMPEKPRTNETSRLAYSLLSASTPEGLLNGKGDVVRALDGNLFERCEQSTFEAPLSDLTDAEPVNYYRIKVHFIFNKSE